MSLTSLKGFAKYLKCQMNFHLTFHLQTDLLNFLQMRYGYCGSTDTEELLKFNRELSFRMGRKSEGAVGWKQGTYAGSTELTSWSFRLPSHNFVNFMIIMDLISKNYHFFYGNTLTGGSWGEFQTTTRWTGKRKIFPKLLLQLLLQFHLLHFRPNGH